MILVMRSVGFWDARLVWEVVLVVGHLLGFALISPGCSRSPPHLGFGVGFQSYGLGSPIMSTNHLPFKAFPAEIRLLGLAAIKSITNSISWGSTRWCCSAAIGKGLPRQYWNSISISTDALGMTEADESIQSIAGVFSRNGISDVNTSWTKTPNAQISMLFVYTWELLAMSFGKSPSISGAG